MRHAHDPFDYDLPREAFSQIVECPVCREVTEDTIHDCIDDDEIEIVAADWDYHASTLRRAAFDSILFN